MACISTSPCGFIILYNLRPRVVIHFVYLLFPSSRTWAKKWSLSTVLSAFSFLPFPSYFFPVIFFVFASYFHSLSSFNSFYISSIFVPFYVFIFSLTANIGVRFVSAIRYKFYFVYHKHFLYPCLLIFDIIRLPFIFNIITEITFSFPFNLYLK
jgi:hypothetical protein